jgi:hypothetical protein
MLIRGCQLLRQQPAPAELTSLMSREWVPPRTPECANNFRVACYRRTSSAPLWAMQDSLVLVSREDFSTREFADGHHSGVFYLWFGGDCIKMCVDVPGSS